MLHSIILSSQLWREQRLIFRLSEVKWLYSFLPWTIRFLKSKIYVFINLINVIDSGRCPWLLESNSKWSRDFYLKLANQSQTFEGKRYVGKRWQTYRLSSEVPLRKYLLPSFLRLLAEFISGGCMTLGRGHSAFLSLPAIPCHGDFVVNSITVYSFKASDWEREREGERLYCKWQRI